jgi:D-alanine-D-alanine ligase
MKNYDVAVIFGGISNENEISIITGTMVCNVLKKGGKSVLPVYIDTKGAFRSGEALANIETFKGDSYTSFPFASVCDGGLCLFNKKGKLKERIKVDVAINCCHGGMSEGGGVCGLFGLNNIPLASANLFESCAFMDKYLTKIVLKSLGVKVADYCYLRHMDGAISQEISLNYPLIVKPCALGSSIGIKKVENESELKCALDTAFELDSAVILESYFKDKREINCAAYMANDRIITSECEEAISDGDLLSFDDKYSGHGKSIYPADIQKAFSDEIKRITADVYSALNMRGIVRFDFIISGNEIYLSEINTVPGSLAYYLLADGFDNFYCVLDAVIDQAKVDFLRSRDKLIINTGIINNFASNACKIK